MGEHKTEGCCLVASLDRRLIRHNFLLKASSKNTGFEQAFKITFKMTYDVSMLQIG